MPAAKVKRGRGRPRGSTVVKNRTPTRRSTRGATASRSQPAVEVQADEHQTDDQESLAPDDPFADDAAWEVERQMMQDGNQTLENRCLKLEEALEKNKSESARRIEEVIHASLEESNAKDDLIKHQRARISELLQRAQEAECREAQLKERIEILQCGESDASASSSSRNDNSPPPPSSPYASSTFTEVLNSSGEDARPPRRPQQGFSATTTRGAGGPQRRTKWKKRDKRTLIKLIGKFGTKYSLLERLWKENFPRRHPRNQGQLKDKARNLKIDFLRKNQPLPKGFNDVGIDAKGVARIERAGFDPYRMEEE